MKPSFTAGKVLVLLFALSMTFLLNGCGSADVGGGMPISSSPSAYNPGYGPFDRNGNYVEAWADKPARQQKWAPQLVVANTPRPKKVEKITAVRPKEKKPVIKPLPPVASVTESKPRPPAALTPQPPSPKPSTAATKPTPVIRHTVVKGDTLYSLSRRYGTSVGAIQRANGISGTLIRIGQRLRMP